MTEEADDLRAKLHAAELTIADLRKCNAVLCTMVRDIRHEHSQSIGAWIEQFGRERDYLLNYIRELEARQ